MKKILFLLVLMSIDLSQTHAQVTPTKADTTISKAKIAEMENTIKNLKNSIATLASTNTRTEVIKKEIIKLGLLQWLIVWMPVLFFMYLFYFFMTRLRKEGFKLADALSSCVPIEVVDVTSALSGIITVPPPAVPANPHAPKEMILLRSSSRLIAFMSGLTAIVISITLMTFYFYNVLAGVNTSETSYLDSVWKIIAGLGIGVLPYGFNMIKEAQKA
jgi:hypothetical protein